MGEMRRFVRSESGALQLWDCSLKRVVSLCFLSLGSSGVNGGFTGFGVLGRCFVGDSPRLEMNSWCFRVFRQMRGVLVAGRICCRSRGTVPVVVWRFCTGDCPRE